MCIGGHRVLHFAVFAHAHDLSALALAEGNGFGSSDRPYHFSRATTALSYAARQSVRYSAKMKSGVSLPFSAEAELIADSMFFRRSFIIQRKANKWMLATAGAALLVYSESSARRARSLSLCRKPSQHESVLDAPLQGQGRPVHAVVKILDLEEAYAPSEIVFIYFQ